MYWSCQSQFDYLNDMLIADSSSTNEIDLIIDSDFYWLVATDTKRGQKDEPSAVKLSWVLNGPVTNFDVSKNFTFENSEHSLFYFWILTSLWEIKTLTLM